MVVSTTAIVSLWRLDLLEDVGVEYCLDMQMRLCQDRCVSPDERCEQAWDSCEALDFGVMI